MESAYDALMTNSSDTFVIHGGKALTGRIAISGSKNAAFPLIAACLLTDETCTLENVPAIQDVEVMLAIARKLGVRVSWNPAAHILTLDAKNLSSSSPDAVLSRRFRGSIILRRSYCLTGAF